jgi:hypothetical protein
MIFALQFAWPFNLHRGGYVFFFHSRELEFFFFPEFNISLYDKNFEFRHFRPYYLDVDTIFGDLGMNAYQS